MPFLFIFCWFFLYLSLYCTKHIITNFELAQAIRAGLVKTVAIDKRKEIEAKGIAEFQKIENRTITPQLLKWKGVEATQEIA